MQITSLKLKNFAVITHAGGPGVIVTDTLIRKWSIVPDLAEKHAKCTERDIVSRCRNCQSDRYSGHRNSGQLEQVIAYCENELTEIDAMIVIFGSPGLGSVTEAYQVIHEMIQTCNKPIFPIFPSVINVKEEINQFHQKG